MGGPELVMGEFTYCTSLDHAKWFIQDLEIQGVEINPEMLDEYPGKRFQIKKWIESNCNGNVWMWNGCDKPNRLSTNWGHLVVPQGGGTFFFELQNDQVLFLMTWT